MVGTALLVELGNWLSACTVPLLRGHSGRGRRPERGYAQGCPQLATRWRRPVNSFQRRMEDRRTELGLTWPKLAERAGMAYSTTRRIIVGPMVQPPKLEQLEGLAKALDLPLIYLQQSVGEVFGYHIYQEQSDEGLQVVVASWAELSDKDRRMVRRMVEELRRENGGGPPDGRQPTAE